MPGVHCVTGNRGDQLGMGRSLRQPSSRLQRPAAGGCHPWLRRIRATRRSLRQEAVAAGVPRQAIGQTLARASASDLRCFNLGAAYAPSGRNIMNAPANAAPRWRIMRISPAPGTLVKAGTALTLRLKLAHPPAAPRRPSAAARSVGACGFTGRLLSPQRRGHLLRAWRILPGLRSRDDRRGRRRRVDYLRGQRRAALGINRLRLGVLLGLPLARTASEGGTWLLLWRPVPVLAGAVRAVGNG
jgi:hypothetical protein